MATRSDGADAYVLAGLVVGRLWTPPPQLRWSALPTTVMTVSECLTDLIATGLDEIAAPWYLDLRAARAAFPTLPADGNDVHVMAVHVPVADRSAVLDLFDGRTGAAGHPIHDNLAAMADPVGVPRGFEVVGFETGQVHSWLCYGLDEDAIGSGQRIRLTRLGLIATLEQARAVAITANLDRDTDQGTPLDITWFPVLVAECRPDPDLIPDPDPDPVPVPDIQRT